MFHLLTILTGLSMICHCCVKADPAVSLHIERSGRSYTVNFDKTVLDLFHQCLCDDDKSACSVDVAKRRFSATTFWAHSQESSDSSGSSEYVNDYFCLLIVHEEFPYEPKALRCYRLKEPITVSQTLPSHPQCHIFSFKSQSTESCDLDCVGIRWTTRSNQNATITQINTEILSCGLCEFASSTTARKTVFTETTGTTSFLPTVNGNTMNTEDSGGNNISIIAGVIVALIVIVAVVVLVVILWRWRSRPKAPAINSFSHYINSAVDHGERAPTENPPRTEDGPSTNSGYDTIISSNDANDSFINYSYASVHPHASGDRNGGAQSVPAEAQTITTDSTETRSTVNHSKDTAVSNVYAKLHEESRDIRNTYDALLDPEGDSNTKRPLQVPSLSAYNGEEQYSLAQPIVSVPANRNGDGNIEIIDTKTSKVKEQD